MLEAGGLEPVCLVDDQEFGAAAGAGLDVDVGVDQAVLVKVDGERDLLARPREPLIDLADGGRDRGGEERGTGLE